MFQVVGRSLCRIIWIELSNFQRRSISRKDYQFPRLEKKDLVEQYISGSGPGGQCVNKSQNCALLKHLPTGIVVKVHESRNLSVNRKIALQRLAEEVDHKLNGENSYISIKKREELDKRSKADRKEAKWRQKRAELDRKLKEWMANDKVPPIS